VRGERRDGRAGRSRPGDARSRRARNGGSSGSYRSGPQKPGSGAQKPGSGPRKSDGLREARERASQDLDPPLPEDVQPADLDRSVRARLRTLSKNNADQVARHLVMAGSVIDSDPELAYAHAQAASRRAGRVDVVREAVALTAYALGRYAEALRELRTVRRLSGEDLHRAIEADCERGLGRPERALALAAEAPSGMSTTERVELAIVESGARLDLGEPEAALLALEEVAGEGGPIERVRVAEHRAAVLEALGRDAEASRLRAKLPREDEDVVFMELPAEHSADAEGAVDGVDRDPRSGDDAPEQERE